MIRVMIGVALALALPVLPASAFDPGALFTINRIRAATPSCRTNPGPVVGRVSGYIGYDGGKIGSFEGCFQSVAECNAWRVPVSGQIDGRLIYNACESR